MSASEHLTEVSFDLPVIGEPIVRDIPRFTDFYRSNADDITKALSLTLGDASLGQEAADEAFTRAYDRWSTISGYDNPQGWVYTAGLNWARSWLRRARRAILHRDPHTVALPPEGGLADTDIDLRRALAQLSDAHRSVVVLRYLLDWSTEDTAAGLGLAPGTVKSRLSRALDHLAELLGEPSSPEDPDIDVEKQP